MSKISKIISILLILFAFSFCINYVQATEEQAIDGESSLSEESDAASAAEQVTSSLDALSASSVTKVSPVNSYDEANLKLNNILSIILIAIGVLLILFAIAIMIRLKK